MRTQPDSTQFCGRRHPSGFTLVEAVLVIGIALILIGLFMPAISSANDAANRTRCLSEMRDLAIRIHQHANDHAGRVPDAFDDHAPGWGDLRVAIEDRVEPSARLRTVSTLYWPYAIMQPEEIKLGNSSLWCERDTELERTVEWAAGELNTTPDFMPLLMHRILSNSFYISPRALSQDRPQWRDEYYKLGSLDTVLFPAQKALLYEISPFHEREWDPISRRFDPDHERSVVAADGSARFRSYAESNLGVFLDTASNIPLAPAGISTSTLREHARRTEVWGNTRDGLKGRDW